MIEVPYSSWKVESLKASHHLSLHVPFYMKSSYVDSAVNLCKGYKKWDYIFRVRQYNYIIRTFLSI